MRRLLSAAALLAALTLAAPAAAVTPSATGVVVSVDYSSLTILQGGRTIPTLSALTRAADLVTAGDYPYVWGGGHERAGTASAGQRGPGYTGHTLGFDCSGAVAAVLAGGNVLDWGAPVGGDADVIATLLRARRIARGPGQVTLFDKPGSHIFMRIGGRYFGTSDGGRGNPSQRHHGAGWIYDGAPDARNRAYKAYHVLPSLLRARTLYGARLTFRIPTWTLINGVLIGDSVRVGYTKSRAAMTARSVSFANAKTAEGTLVAVGADGISFTLQLAGGALRTFANQDASTSLDSGDLGDRLRVLYTTAKGARSARSVTVLGAATLLTASGTITAVADDGSSLTLQTADGRTITFSTGGDSELLDGRAAGDDVQVSYVRVLATNMLREVNDVPEPPSDLENPDGSLDVRPGG